MSQFWRNVALHTQSLWTHIDLRYDGAELFANRSYGQPIDIIPWYDQWEKPRRRLRALEWLPTHASLVWKILLTAPNITIQKVNSTLNLNLYLLEELTVEGTDRRGACVTFQAPNLRRPELISTITNLYPNLTNFSFEKRGLLTVALSQSGSQSTCSNTAPSLNRLQYTR